MDFALSATEILPADGDAGLGNDVAVYADPAAAAARAVDYVEAGFTGVKLDPMGGYSAFDPRQPSLERLNLAEAMVDAETVVEDISEEGKLLTLNTKTALEYKMADVEASSLEEALAALGLEGPTREVERTWSESLVAFLTSQAIASLLMLGMMVLGYIEMQSPGFGVFGAGALTCFLLLYFSHYLVNLAGYEELLLFGLGVILPRGELFGSF